MTDPHITPEQAAMIADLIGPPPDPLGDLARQVHELTLRVEDLAATLATYMQTAEPEYDQPPPAAVALIQWYGACPHGRVLRYGCRECGTKEYRP